MENRPQFVVAESREDENRERDEALIRRYADIALMQFLTDPSYLKQYFADNAPPEVLLVSEEDLALIPHPEQIPRIVVTVRDAQEERSWPDNVTLIPKQAPRTELFSRIDAALSGEEPAPGPEARETRIAAVYSPIGGCGKSLTAIALARKLRKLDQKVLVVGCDPMQSFSVFLENSSWAGEELAECLKHPSEDTYWTILQNIRTDGISWLCPFERSLSSVGVGAGEWEELCRTLSEKRDFDVIILDLGTDMSSRMVEMVGRKATLVLLTETNEIANRKLQKLLKNPQLLPKCECILVANEYHSDGIRIARESLFGTIAPYPDWEEAMNDPVFYRIALQITE